MFSETAELYDLIYSSFKDYHLEAEKIARLIRRVVPSARTALDVGCGTGTHAGFLSREHGISTDGLDLEPAFVDLARRKNPEQQFFVGDMASFSLGRSYDVVLCLFSSIAYLLTPVRITAALRCFREHVASGGVVIVEPWFVPEVWQLGRVETVEANGTGVKVVRMSHAGLKGRVSIVTFHYLVGSAVGIDHRQEVHELGLLTKDEMLACFEEADLAAEFEPEGLIGRGLYVARPF